MLKLQCKVGFSTPLCNCISPLTQQLWWKRVNSICIACAGQEENISPPPFSSHSTEEPLSDYISIWSAGCKVSDRTAPQKVVRSAEKFMGLLRHLHKTIRPPGIRREVSQHPAENNQQLLSPSNQTAEFPLLEPPPPPILPVHAITLCKRLQTTM